MINNTITSIMQLLLVVFLFFVCVCFGDASGIKLRRFKRQGPIGDPNSNIENNNSCSCVFQYQCDSEGYIIINGEGLIDERFGDTPRIVCAGGKYPGELVCCKHRTREENNVSTSSATSPTANSTTFTTSPTRSSVRSPKSLPCGKPLSTVVTFNTRIFTDDLTPIAGEFPWLAAIYRKDRYTSQWKPHKAGSLIHPRVVLTACHVVGWAKPSDFKVIVNGKIELSQIGDDVEQERNVEKIIKHPNFSSGTLYNNIALLILEAPYNGTSTGTISSTNTICLRPEIPYENKRCFVAGWGKSPEEDASMILKKVELPTHPPEKCEQMLRSTRYGPSYVFHESFMCAGGEEGKDACYGDGGSPLVCASGIEDTMYQVGIVAYGVACGKKDVPGIYSNVNYFNNWIVKTMKEHDIYI